MNTTLILSALFFSVWLFTVIEFIGAHSFKYWLFGLGPVILRKTIEFPDNDINVAPGTTIKRETGKYRFRGNGRVYFLSRLELFELKLRTPFAYKFTGVVDAPGRLQVTARLPWGSLLFFLFGLLMLVFAVPVILQDAGPSPMIMLLIGVCFFGGLFWISYAIENRRARRMLLELQQILIELNWSKDARV